MEKDQRAWVADAYGRLLRVNRNRHLYSIRTAFISAVPLLIIGAFAIVLSSLPIPAYQGFMGRIFGESWVLLSDLVFNATIQIVSLLVCFEIGSNLARWYNTNRGWMVHKNISGMVALSSFVLMNVSVNKATGIPFSVTGVQGLFVALVLSLLASEMFIRIYAMRKPGGIWGEEANPAVPRSFAAVWPAMAVVGLFALLRVVMVVLGVRQGLGDLVDAVLAAPYKNVTNPFGAGLLYTFSSHLMWMFGIHGTNVLDEVAQGVFIPAMEENILLSTSGMPAANIVTKTMMDSFVFMGGAGATLGLLIAAVLFSKRYANRSLLRFSAPLAIFNINEPLIFGLPIVLNPLYIVPFVCTPIVMYCTTYFAMWAGLVPVTIAEISWSTPIFLSGYFSTGSFAGVILQVFNLALAVLLYMPFVRLADRLSTYRFKQAYKDMCDAIFDDYDPSRQMMNRDDEVGAVARVIANQLGNAPKSGDMYLVYQPIVNALTGELHSVEALLRWKHEEYGMINPFVAIQLAEETGQADEIGLWILEQAVMRRAEWTKQGLADFHVSVNFSSSQLNDAGLHKKIDAILKRHGVPPHQLQVEITETAALVENDSTTINLGRLSEMGVPIAMDDFGVGHSSLTYLQSQPFTTLKIDASLSRGVEKNETNREIVATILHLCEQMKLETIVEFVDNRQQLDCLMQLGAVYIQGYYFSAPIEGGDMSAFAAKFAERREWLSCELPHHVKRK